MDISRAHNIWEFDSLLVKVLIFLIEALNLILFACGRNIGCSQVRDQCLGANWVRALDVRSRNPKPFPKMDATSRSQQVNNIEWIDDVL
jgi:hypothetical protein